MQMNVCARFKGRQQGPELPSFGNILDRKTLNYMLCDLNWSPSFLLKNCVYLENLRIWNLCCYFLEKKEKEKNLVRKTPTNICLRQSGIEYIKMEIL